LLVWLRLPSIPVNVRVKVPGFMFCGVDKVIVVFAVPFNMTGFELNVQLE
jgi:hypothetical protein